MTYDMRVTIVCPEAMIPDANQLALVLGESAADDLTFGAPGYRDASGNRYAAASTLAAGSFATAAAGPLTAPAHAPDADLAAAGRAQAALYIHGQHGTEGAAAGRLWALVDTAQGDAQAALAAAGVTRLPDPEAAP